MRPTLVQAAGGTHRGNPSRGTGVGSLGYPAPVDEVHLAERLIAIDTSERPGVELALDFVAGWLEGRCVPLREERFGDRRCVRATVGGGPLRVVFNGHLDVVPGHPEQFTPVRRDGRLYGRGAYDMKAALAAMMLAVSRLGADGLEGVEVELIVVPDEERAEPGPNCSEMIVRDGLRADFVICGEPTDLHVGVQAKGVAMLRVGVPGLAAHGSTPWLGRNAILRAVDVYERIGRLPFTRVSTAMFPSPSVNLGRIAGGDALNKVPDHCDLYIDVRPLPGQDLTAIVSEIRSIDPDIEVEVIIARPPADLAAGHPMVVRLLETARAESPGTEPVGRDGSSDAVAFLEVGVPAVEFGPTGAGHHGPVEWVDMADLARYRRILESFVRRLAARPPAVVA